MPLLTIWVFIAKKDNMNKLVIHTTLNFFIKSKQQQ